MPNPAPIDSSLIVIGGPCKITDVATVIYFEGDVVLEPKPVYRPVPNSITGENDDTVVDQVFSIRGVPKAVWTAGYRGVLLPDAYYNYAAAGGRLVGAANRAVTILGSDGDQYAFTRAAITKMPDLFLGLGESLYSEAEWSGFIGQGKNLTDADAFYVKTANVAWNSADYPATNQEALCSAAWGAAAGWGTVFAEKGFKLTHEFKTNPIKQGNVTVDHKIESYRGRVGFVAQGPTASELEAAMILPIGARRSSNANDFIISGSGISVTLKSAGVDKSQFHFDNKMNRLGEIELVNALAAPGTRLVFA